MPSPSTKSVPPNSRAGQETNNHTKSEEKEAEGKTYRHEAKDISQVGLRGWRESTLCVRSGTKLSGSRTSESRKRSESAAEAFGCEPIICLEGNAG